MYLVLWMCLFSMFSSSPSSFFLLSSFILLPQFEIIVDEDSTIGENQLFGTAYCTVGTLLDAAGGGEIQVRGKNHKQYPWFSYKGFIWGEVYTCGMYVHTSSQHWLQLLPISPYDTTYLLIRYRWRPSSVATRVCVSRLRPLVPALIPSASAICMVRLIVFYSIGFI